MIVQATSSMPPFITKHRIYIAEKIWEGGGFKEYRIKGDDDKYISLYSTVLKEVITFKEYKQKL